MEGLFGHSVSFFFINDKFLSELWLNSIDPDVTTNVETSR
jgi:hypothetical protein